jgi:methylated-DNA-protein-cysteine methyltransferase-like protein
MEFERKVKAFIRAIPRGKVATYAQVAALAGNHRAARQVARVLHSSSEKDHLPWHRVINSRGSISLAPGRGFEEQRKLLRAEGVKVTRGGRIDLAVFFWEPAGGPFQGMARRLEELDYAARAEDGRRPSRKPRKTF